MKPDRARAANRSVRPRTIGDPVEDLVTEPGDGRVLVPGHPKVHQELLEAAPLLIAALDRPVVRVFVDEDVATGQCDSRLERNVPETQLLAESAHGDASGKPALREPGRR